MDKIAGLDVHSKSSTFIVQNAVGDTIAEGEIATTSESLERWVHEFGLMGGRIGLETGGMSTFVAEALTRAGATAVIIDAAEVRKKARSKKQKSDRRDAFEICDGLRRDIYISIVKVPSAQAQKLRRILTTRRHFVRMRAKQIHCIKALLRSVGLGDLLRGGRNIRTDAILRKLERSPRLNDDLRGLVKHYRLAWLLAHKQIAMLDGELERRECDCAEDSARLQTIPGVGPVVALTTIAVLDDVNRFETAKQVGSYAGLVAQTYNSGGAERSGRITKRGSPELRAMLLQAAQQTRKPMHPLHSFYVRIAKRSGCKRALIAVAHKLLRIMWVMLKKRTDFDPSKHVSRAWAQLTAETAN